MEESEGRSHVQVDQQDDEEFVHIVNLTDNEQQEQEKNAEMSPDVDINANLDKLFPSHFSNLFTKYIILQCDIKNIL